MTTYNYCAPEVYHVGDADGPGYYLFASDTFSLALVLAECGTGRSLCQPMRLGNVKDMRRKILEQVECFLYDQSLETPEQGAEELAFRNFLVSALQSHPEARQPSHILCAKLSNARQKPFEQARATTINHT